MLEYLIITFNKMFEEKTKVPMISPMPLKILYNFLVEHEDLPNYILKDISLNLIRYIAKYYNSSSS